MLETLFRYLSSFGPYWTARVYVLPKLRSLASGESVAVLSQKPVKEFVAKAIAPVIDKYKDAKIEEPKPIPEDCPIWVCWWQGEDLMPEISRYCIHSIIKNRGKHPVIFISKDNYQNYVSIPSLYIQRLEANEISITNFTDVLRILLLQRNGGIWLDSATWMINPLHIEGHAFYSKKNIGDKPLFISNNRWTVGVIGGASRMILFDYLADCFHVYWSKYHCTIDYLLLDYFINSAYDNIHQIRVIIDALPPNNPNFYALKNNLNSRFDEIAFYSLCNENNLLNLNRREKVKEYDNDGELTYFGFLKRSHKKLPDV